MIEIQKDSITFFLSIRQKALQSFFFFFLDFEITLCHFSFVLKKKKPYMNSVDRIFVISLTLGTWQIFFSLEFPSLDVKHYIMFFYNII